MKDQQRTLQTLEDIAQVLGSVHVNALDKVQNGP